MRVITVEEHFESPVVTEQMQQVSGGHSMPPVSPEMLHYMQTTLPTPAIMGDVTNERIAFMDKYGIDMQVLSYGNSSPQNLDPKVAVSLAKTANDELAKVVKANPKRFAGLAVLPVGDPDAAAKELTRAVQELGLKGVLLKGNYQNKFFDDPFFFPIFKAASDLNVPVYFHPSFIPNDITQHYFTNQHDQWSDVVTGILSSAGFGWHMDVGIQVMRFITSGIFDELPNLKIISGHWGEFIPMFLERLDDELTPYTKLKLPFSSYYRNNVYVTPSGILSKPQLDFMLAEMGADHILYSVDYPYKQPTTAGTFLIDSDLSEVDKNKLASGNAAKLFGL